MQAESHSSYSTPQFVSSGEVWRFLSLSRLLKKMKRSLWLSKCHESTFPRYLWGYSMLRADLHQSPGGASCCAFVISSFQSEARQTFLLITDPHLGPCESVLLACLPRATMPLACGGCLDFNIWVSQHCRSARSYHWDLQSAV